jgi:predicted DNA-binding antitoxin AbrB/MazE fold protein
MTQVDAIYRNGVFNPLGVVALPENQRVRLSVHPLEADNDVRAWLARVQQRQRRIVSLRGYYPDSAADIAEDRRR